MLINFMPNLLMTRFLFVLDFCSCAFFGQASSAPHTEIGEWIKKNLGHHILHDAFNRHFIPIPALGVGPNKDFDRRGAWPQLTSLTLPLRFRTPE
jgi:hypothetical protein